MDVKARLAIVVGSLDTLHLNWILKCLKGLRVHELQGINIRLFIDAELEMQYSALAPEVIYFSSLVLCKSQWHIHSSA